MKKLTLISIAILSFTFFNCASQIEAATTSEDMRVLIGSWVAEGSSLDDKWVFQDNGKLKKYTNGVNDDTFNWSINNFMTPSGLIIKYLKTYNSIDLSEFYVYEINTLSDERLVLVYQRPGGGIGKLMTYIKQ